MNSPIDGSLPSGERRLQNARAPGLFDVIDARIAAFISSLTSLGVTPFCFAIFLIIPLVDIFCAPFITVGLLQQPTVMLYHKLFVEITRNTEGNVKISAECAGAVFTAFIYTSALSGLSSYRQRHKSCGGLLPTASKAFRGAGNL